jgi:hypothetical protein
MQQSEAARLALCKTAPLALNVALLSYSKWLKDFSIDRSSNGWSLGATFDHVVIQDAFIQCKLDNPIHYSRQLCLRTVSRLSGVPKPNDDGLIGHNAVDDAIRQVIWFQQCLRVLKSNG